MKNTNPKSLNLSTLLFSRKYFKEFEVSDIPVLWGIFLFLALVIPIINTILPVPFVDIGNTWQPILLTIFSSIFIILKLLVRIKSQKHINFTPLFVSRLFAVTIVTLFIAYSSFNVLRGLNAPMLHDPYDHSIWAKGILITDQIDFFYSPLLHSATALFSFNQIDKIPWVLTFFTQLATFLIPVNYGILFLYFVKKPKYALIFFLAISCLHFPSSLYYEAGKNALILGLSLIPFAVISIDKLAKSPNLKNVILTTISLFIIFMSHYPTLGVFLFLIVLWVLNTIFQYIRKSQYRKMLIYISPFLLSLALSILWFIPLYPQQVDYKNQTLSPVNNQDIAITIDGVISTFRLYFDKYVVKGIVPWHVIFLLPLFMKGVNINLRVLYVWTYISRAISHFFVEALYLSDLLIMFPNAINIIFASVLSYGSILAVSLTFLKTKLEKIPYLLLLILLTTIAIISRVDLNTKTFSAQQAFNVVDQDDLKAYQYIEESLPDNVIILNASRADVDRKGVNFPVDGGLWIPLFTNNDVTVDFQNFSSLQTIENNSLFQRIVTEENDKQVISEIKNLGVEYAYMDKGIYGQSLTPEILNGVDYEIIFESGTVKIIKF